MPNFKEGDAVRIVTREVTDEDRKANRYFNHMAGLTGVVQNIYGPEEIAVKVDLETLSPIARDVHRVSVERMREKLPEEIKRNAYPEELNFDTHYVLLVREMDLEAISA